MRLPRRVPWASVSELDQVCAWIYADENDIDAKILALHRVSTHKPLCVHSLTCFQLSAWKTITTLPHALESTLAILTAIVQDSSSQSSSSRLHIRQSYASAIIRLVNGLVDPLQLGAYARSIASIAAQLDLPAWLVEIRHAATHEDLPSIEVLRDAARDVSSLLSLNSNGMSTNLFVCRLWVGCCTTTFCPPSTRPQLSRRVRHRFVLFYHS